MSPYPYTIVVAGDGRRVLTALLPDLDPITVPGDHPNFDRINLELDSGSLSADEIAELADLSITIATKFCRLSERVSVANGRVYFDGDEAHGAIVNHILRSLDESEDVTPLVAFMENVAANPTEHSREQLYEWLNAHDFTITQDGLIVGYKGVTKSGDGSLVSGFKGRAIVDGQPITGQIPNKVGSTIEMPRSEVAHDPAAACSRGLHVGVFDYAKSYARGAMLRVLVNPRDVVSVPTDAGGQKVRVCRYVVDRVIDAPETCAILCDDAEESLDDGDYECWFCGDYFDRDEGDFDVDGDFICEDCAS